MEVCVCWVGGWGGGGRVWREALNWPWSVGGAGSRKTLRRAPSTLSCPNWGPSLKAGGIRKAQPLKKATDLRSTLMLGEYKENDSSFKRIGCDFETFDKSPDNLCHRTRPAVLDSCCCSYQLECDSTSVSSCLAASIFGMGLTILIHWWSFWKKGLSLQRHSILFSCYYFALKCLSVCLKDSIKIFTDVLINTFTCSFFF